MNDSVYNFPSSDFMSIYGDNLVGMRCHVGFDTGVIFQSHQKGVPKVILYMCNLIIVRVGIIWN